MVTTYKDTRKGLYAIAHTLLDMPYYIFVVTSAYIALRYLVLPDQVAMVVRVIFLVLLILWLSRALIIFLSILITKFIDDKDEQSASMTKTIVNLTLKIVVWITAVLLILINL